jgi:N-methylhydantoinase B
VEVFHHLFAAVGEEMGVTLMRSSFSPNIKERRDFSCALFDGEGRMIAQAAHLPVHLGAAPMSVAAARAAVRMEPGDAVLLNDPYAGGTHLPDLTLITPVFLEGSGHPRFFVANRAHHADVGGHAPGSMAPARDIHGEGLRIPPVRLVRGGEVDEALLGVLLANMRVTRERRADLFAQWAANRVGVARLEAMAREYGAEELERRAAQLMDWTEELSRARLGELPEGRFEFEDALELPDGGEAVIRLAIERRGARVRFDFSGTDDQLEWPLNTVPAVPRAAVFYALQQRLPAGTPANDGVLRPVELVTRPGSLVDARYPAPVAAGNVETSQRLVDVLQGALAQVWPGAVPAASCGTMSNLTFGGEDGGEPFAYYETIAGGAGAGPEGAGAHAVQTHMTNTRNTPVEALETQLPVRVLAYTVRRGSGGRGRLAGGDGVVRRLRFLRAVRLGFVAERTRRGPEGREGGAAGRSGGARVRLPGGRSDRALPGKGTWDLPPGAEVEVRTPGGGGFGA